MKNNCPYQDNQKRCTHKCPSVQRRSGKKIPNCLYNNAIKCEMYLTWQEEITLITKLPRAIQEDILDRGENL